MREDVFYIDESSGAIFVVYTDRGDWRTLECLQTGEGFGASQDEWAAAINGGANKWGFGPLRRVAADMRPLGYLRAGRPRHWTDDVQEKFAIGERN